MSVETPPLRTAGPMSTRAACALSLLQPDTVKKAWQMCTGGGIQSNALDIIQQHKEISVKMIL